MWAPQLESIRIQRETSETLRDGPPRWGKRRRCADLWLSNGEKKEDTKGTVIFSFLEFLESRKNIKIQGKFDKFLTWRYNWNDITLNIFNLKNYESQTPSSP